MTAASAAPIAPIATPAVSGTQAVSVAPTPTQPASPQKRGGVFKRAKIDLLQAQEQSRAASEKPAESPAQPPVAPAQPASTKQTPQKKSASKMGALKSFFRPKEKNKTKYIPPAKLKPIHKQSHLPENVTPHNTRVDIARALHKYAKNFETVLAMNTHLVENTQFLNKLSRECKEKPENSEDTICKSTKDLLTQMISYVDHTRTVLCQNQPDNKYCL